MIDWNKIQESHTMKLTRYIGYKSWGVDIRFYDKQSSKRIDLIPYQNPLCRFINSNVSGAKSCCLYYEKHLKELYTTHKPSVYQCIFGLQGVAVPIIINEIPIGTIIGSGMRTLKENALMQDRYIHERKAHGLDEAEVQRLYQGLSPVSDNDIKYLLDFIKVAAKDGMVFYETLQEREPVNGKRSDSKYSNIIGTSQAVKRILDTLELVESFDSPVLIEGESGTGKELIATNIHYNSSRKDKTFVVQNCSVFSDTLLNSELFGHERGSFTGAISDKKGLFEIADGGTLFLDEIGDMNKEAQAKLLRVLEDGTFYRVGGTKPTRVDVRIIAATNKELKKQIELGLFRKDLFYRINTISVTLPPLKERREDIVFLINYFLEYYKKSPRDKRKEISHEVLEFLMAYDWPGNIRELKNLIERLIVFSAKERMINLHHLPREIFAACSVSQTSVFRKNGTKLKHALESLEKEIVTQTLKRAKWNKTIASRELGISRASLNNRITEFDIQQD